VPWKEMFPAATRRIRLNFLWAHCTRILEGVPGVRVRAGNQKGAAAGFCPNSTKIDRADHIALLATIDHSQRNTVLLLVVGGGGVKIHEASEALRVEAGRLDDNFHCHGSRARCI